MTPPTHGSARPQPSVAYLDHAATTPMVPEAVEAYVAATAAVGNASSLHAPGRDARRRVEEARECIAASLGARPSEVIFTGGGTESDNLAVKGLWWARRAADPRRTRIIASAIEHHAVLDAVQWLVEVGAEVTWLPVDPYGRVSVDALREELARYADEVALVTTMWANNEVGTVQPVAELAAVAAEHGVPFHTDAIQAVGQVAVDFAACGASALTVTGHKLGGPAGVGALLLGRDVEATPLLHGGGQERDVRSGTLDVAGISAFAVAVELAVQPGGDPGDEWSSERQVEESVALGPVVRDVADRIAVIDEGVEIGQSAADAAPERGLPQPRPPAHDGDADGGAECELSERVHARPESTASLVRLRHPLSRKRRERVRASETAVRPPSLAEALQVPLCHGRETLARELPRLGRVHNVLERPRDQHLPDPRMLGGSSSHLVEDGEAAVDLLARHPVLFNRPGEVLAEAGEEEVVVVAYLKTRFGKEVGEVLLEILSNALKTGPRVAVSRRFALLHLGIATPPRVRTTITGRHERYHTPRRGANVKARGSPMQYSLRGKCVPFVSSFSL